MFRAPVCIRTVHPTRPPVLLRNSEDQRTLVRAVLVPFKNGLTSFNHLSEMLLSVDADIVLPGSQTFDNIRQEILKMNMYLEKSEEIASKELQSLDKETEHLTVTQGNLESQKKEMEGRLANLNTQMEGHRATLNNYSKALETERRNLRSAQSTLNDMRHKRDEAEKLRNIGIGMMFVPFGGWIAGSVMIGIGQKDLDSASDQVNRAKTEVERCETQLRIYSQQVSVYEALISQARTAVQMVNSGIHEIGVQLRALSIKRESTADFQSKTRKAVQHLGLLSGVGSVAELQTRRLILLEAMLNVMEEMMSALTKMGDDLVRAEGMQGIMQEMKSNQSKLQAAIQKDESEGHYF
ncbi:uncharacterized protein LOC112151738 [Oryzias melastigma]|uniref:uncharacterized protein LOC112151738 n=1 Tax=Oryzias melastigma TaxID=30732 RepID=UPI000CF7F6DF|nr:uncharacterized protein LOC112151738 [Oryzias melastigma]